jgi:hypothetical protein
LKIFPVLLATLGMAAATRAGVVYDVAVRPVDESNLLRAAADSSVAGAIVTRYFVRDGVVRVGGPNAKTVFVFNDRTMWVIDNPTRTAHNLAHATLDQVAAHYADAVKQLEDSAAAAAPDARAAAQQKALDMKTASDRLLQRVIRQYRVTARFESVDGHACRIWEERERDAKRLELCVAPAATVPGGAELLGGMKTLSRFRQGADFALGVELGLSAWWPDFATVGGVPLLVREYKYDSVVSEIMLTGMREETLSPALFAVPEGYTALSGPEYAVWSVR